MKSIKARAIIIAEKEGLSVREMMEKFGCTDEAELEDLVNRIIGHRNTVRRILNSARKAQKEKDRAEIAKKKDEEPAEDTFEELPEEPAEESRCAEELTEKAPKKSREEFLRELEAEVSRKVATLEAEHKSVYQRKASNYEKLLDVKIETREISKRLNELTKIWEELFNLNTQLHAEMEAKQAEINSANTKLVNIRKEIEELSVIEIMVDTDDICIDGDEMPEVDDEQVKSILSTLILISEAENLTVAELKTIAKVKVIVETFCNKAKIEFISKEMQEVYNKI